MKTKLFEKRNWKDRDIRVGDACVPFDYDRKVWALIGGAVTNSEDVAFDHACRINEAIGGGK